MGIFDGLAKAMFGNATTNTASTPTIDDYIKAAEAGNASAQYNLGVCYGNGYGCKKDAEKAVYWYTKAAEQGHATSQYNLGWCYGNGYGCKKDAEKAVYWYTKAAEQGDASAQYNLGLRYGNGEGCKKDAEKAVHWYTKAAEQGDASAQYNLGMRYEDGNGCKKDAEKAVHWYTKAAEQGHAKAQEALGDMAKAGIAKTVAVKTDGPSIWLLSIPREEIGKSLAQFTARHPALEDRLVLAGSASGRLQGALSVYGALEWDEEPIILYDDTLMGGAKDGFLITNKNVYTHKAYAKSYGKLSIGDITKIQNINNDIVFDSIEAPVTNSEKDDRKSMVVFLRGLIKELNFELYNDHTACASEDFDFDDCMQAAEMGNVGAQYNLARCYASGIYCGKDAATTFAWYKEAAEQGHTDAQYMLALYYADGAGCEKDAKKSCQWCEKAAEQGHAKAQCMLALFYKTGFGGGRNVDKALEWYRKAAEQGNAEAQAAIASLGNVEKA